MQPNSLRLVADLKRSVELEYASSATAETIPPFLMAFPASCNWQRVQYVRHVFCSNQLRELRLWGLCQSASKTPNKARMDNPHQSLLGVRFLASFSFYSWSVSWGVSGGDAIA
jgi:hypothetical protein